MKTAIERVHLKKYIALRDLFCSGIWLLTINILFSSIFLLFYNLVIVKGPPTKRANTWEVDAKGDLNEDESEKTSELGLEGGGGGQLGGDQVGGQEEDRGEKKTLMVNMMMTIIMMMVMKVVEVASWEAIRVEMRKRIVESRRPQ